eukprot:gene2220-8488_t
MAGGADDGERRGRGEQRRMRQSDERRALEKLYCEQMPKMFSEGVKLRDFMAVKNAAMQSLLKQHAEENTTAFWTHATAASCRTGRSSTSTPHAVGGHACKQRNQNEPTRNLPSAVATKFNTGTAKKQIRRRRQLPRLTQKYNPTQQCNRRIANDSAKSKI